MLQIPEDVLLAVERHFHALIREQTGDLVGLHGIELPKLASLLAADKQAAWFPVPGMVGGFKY